MSHEFHVRPALEDTSTVYKKFITFPYSCSARFRQHRYTNRSDIIHSHPYSIRIEAYEMNMKGTSFLMAVWQYSIMFDYLPIFHLAKVLHLSMIDRWYSNRCSNQSCPRNPQCHWLMNDRHLFMCLCKPDFIGKNCTIRDEQCVAGYCAQGSLCLPNRYGDRCEIIDDHCQVKNSCLNGGSCYPNFQLNLASCLCTKEYYGKHCEIKKGQVRLLILDPIPCEGVTIQDFKIDLLSLKLKLVYGEVYRQLPQTITHFYDSDIVSGIIIAKMYRSYDLPPVDLYLFSVAHQAQLVKGTTKMSDRIHCKNIRSISNSNFYSDRRD